MKRYLLLALLTTSVNAAEPVRWRQVALPAPANGDLQQTDEQLLVAGEDKQQRFLTRIDTRSWQASAITLPPGADHFCTLADGKVLLFAGNQVYLAGRSQPLGKIDSYWLGQAGGRIRAVSWCHGQQLLVPGFVALRVYQVGDEGLQLQATLPVPVMTDLANGGVRYQAPKRFWADVNLDGKDDLLVEQGQGLQLYLATADGFLPQAISFAPELALTPPARRAFRTGDDFSKLRIRSVEKLVDLNGDGLSDLIIENLSSKSLLDQNISYELHLGRKTENGLAFTVTPDSRFNAEGVPFALNLADVNGDGRQDLYSSSVKMGLGKVVSALLTGSVDVDLHLEQLDRQGRLQAVGKGIEAQMAVSIGSGQFSIPLIAAVTLKTGVTMAVQDDDKSLLLYRLVGKQLKRYQKLTLPLPKDGSRWRTGRGYLAIFPGPQDKTANHLLLVGDDLPSIAEP
ncbi:FG-GAP repeat domain-containing protein [Gallaecimonas sp. GXIMD1310]|uniref:FG-GAP repeat domain-containing protein n=1 Tax=Gallaecimonas sp. GXIMD1310 TaxID=3131926 RepID=UPI0032542C48